MNKLNLFKNASITEREFLRDYWHKKPILLRNAIDIKDLEVFPTKSKLIELSTDEDIQSRIVFKNNDASYGVEYGAFTNEDFQGIDDHCWNLLVSDIDKWLPDTKNILKYFSFVRNFIFDDIMLSCGSVGGTVGPHIDQYDVFLFQAQGQRQWDFTHTITDESQLLPDQPLKILSNFSSDSSFTLNPGDVLYLPPEIGHYGKIVTTDCITCSIGTRTPSHGELMTSFIDNLAQNLPETARFKEPEFENFPKTGEITQQDLNQISQILIKNIKHDKQLIKQWFGKYITQYRSLFYEFNQSQGRENFDPETDLELSSFSKSCYIKSKENAKLTVDGLSFDCTIELAQWICNSKALKTINYRQLTNTDKKIVKNLFENGSLIQNQTKA